MTKRFHVSQGNTPGKPKAKSPKASRCKAKKSLFGGDPHSEDAPANTLQWTTEETKSLIQYIALYWQGNITDGWPSTKNMNFWNACAIAIAEATELPRRSGGSCRTRVQKHLKKKFSTLSQAEEEFRINYFDDLSSPVESPVKCGSPSPLSPLFGRSHTPTKAQNTKLGQIIPQFMEHFKENMSSIMRKQLMNYIFKVFIEKDFGLNFLHFLNVSILENVLCSTQLLYNANKTNIIDKLAQIIGDGRLSLEKMPYGLIDYNIQFLAADHSQSVKIEDHYAAWQETMLAHFGHKWVSLQRGPYWQYDQELDAQDDTVELKGVEGSSDIVEEALSLAEINSYTEAEMVTYDDGCAQKNECLGDENVGFLSDCDVAAIDRKNDEISVCCSLQDEIDTGGEKDVDVVCSDGNCSFGNKGIVSSLWHSLSQDEMEEIQANNPSDIAIQHGVVQPKHRIQRNSNLFKTNKAFVNVAGLGSVQLLKRIQSYGFKRDAKIQIEALKKIKKCTHRRSGRWWIKADACDIRRGLRESVKGKWSGDEDLDDGLLEQLETEYKDRVEFANVLGVKEREGDTVLDLRILVSVLNNDLVFLEDGLKLAKQTYEAKIKAPNTSEELKMELSWNVIGFEGLINQSKELRKSADDIEEVWAISKGNIGRKLYQFRNNLLKYTKELYSKKRTAATHLMVFMIADELRNFKPYAVPVRVMPYSSIKDSQLRELVNELKSVMTSMDMLVVGVVTDGEFNSLRTRGSKRPISIIQLISDARNEARSTPSSRIEKSLRLNANGSIQQPHPAVPVDDVHLMNDWLCREMPFISALKLLRRKQFPFTYDPCSWIEGKEEEKSDCLKSLLAIYLFRAKINWWKAQGVDFSKHLVVSELDERTSEQIHQREDHNHLLKRIVGCMREGKMPEVDVCYFRDALHSPDTGLTYEALTGKNKQSVPDCERMISPGVLEFMRRNGHQSEAEVLTILHNWHKAVDGRGLTEETRSHYCKDMKNWLLRDWIPYLDQVDDYYAIDVNKPIKGICGLTREVVVGLVANLETREQRRQDYALRGLPFEHPRASSTDDVEGFIALLHEMLGANFDLKQFYDEFPKIMNEFIKKIDPDLPFFYWTGTNNRFRQFALPSFNKPSGAVERLDRVKISRRGDPGIFVANRASLPQKNQLTVRANFHKAPIALPPVHRQ